MSKENKLTTDFTAFGRNFYFNMGRAALGWNFDIIIIIIIIIIITLFVSLYALMCFPPVLNFN
jgi:hypothetical protein